jgi:hypothetical protein
LKKALNISKYQQQIKAAYNNYINTDVGLAPFLFQFCFNARAGYVFVKQFFCKSLLFVFCSFCIIVAEVRVHQLFGGRWLG